MKKTLVLLSAATLSITLLAKPKVSGLKVTAYPDQEKIEVTYNISGMSGNNCGSVGVTLTTMETEEDEEFVLMFAPLEGYGNNGTHTVMMDAASLSRNCEDMFDAMWELYPDRYWNYYAPNNNVDRFLYYLKNSMRNLDIVYVNVYDVCKSGDDFSDSLFAYASTDNIKVKKGSSSSSVSPAAASIYGKAMTRSGCVYDSDDELWGTATLKFGKISKKGVVKVSATITPFVGKKLTASASFTPDASGDIYGRLKFKSPVGNLTIGAGRGDDSTFYCWMGNDSEDDGEYLFEECTIGGNLPDGEIPFSLELDDNELPYEDFYIIDDLLPEDTYVTVKNGSKLTVPGKAPKVKFIKIREGDETYYEPSWEGGDYANPSALKLSYKPKTGALTGSFKIYATNWGSVGDNIAPKVKTFTAKVSGVVINGVASGYATVKIGKTTFAMPFFFGE